FCRNLASNYWAWRHGLPDLFLWHSETKREAYCRWVEVKGPGDSLSCAQEAWIDALVEAGADFVLLRVEDTAGLPA
ncbi:unnamed protein product, partial [Hapterophycus canaliculatus]